MQPAAPNGRGNGSGSPPGIRRLRTFVAYVEDLPGVLNRVTSLFRRRAYNIDSLTVGRTEVPGVSRMTIVMEGDATTARLVEANLYKLVNVLRIEDVTEMPSLIRDLALIKVRADADKRRDIMQIAEVFRARVVDMTPETLIIEITDSGDKIQSLVDVLVPFGIVEMARTGVAAMTRGAEGIPIDPGFVQARVPQNGQAGQTDET